MNRYLKRSEDPEVLIEGLTLLNTFEPQGDEDYFAVMFILQTNNSLNEKWQERKSELEERLASAKDPEVKAALQKRLLEAKRILSVIQPM